MMAIFFFIPSFFALFLHSLPLLSFFTLFLYSLSLISLFLLWSDPDFLLLWLYIPVSSCWIVPVVMYVGSHNGF